MFSPTVRRLPMRVAPLLFATLLGVPTTLVPAQVPHPHHQHKHLEREQIVELEKEWQAAALANDVPTMDKLLSDDYLGITSTGEVLTKAQQLDHMRNRELVLTRLDISELKIKLIGNIAIVTSLAQVQGTTDGEQLHGAYRYTRVYQRLSNGSWKITNFEVTPTTRLHPDSPQPAHSTPPQ